MKLRLIVSVLFWLSVAACASVPASEDDPNSKPYYDKIFPAEEWSKEAYYDRMFTGKKWSKGPAFSNWAESFPTVSEKTACAVGIKNRIADVGSILFCEQVATIQVPWQDIPAQLVFAILRAPVPSKFGHDCIEGLIYLDRSLRIIEDSPTDCAYVMEMEQPSSTPILVFKIIETAEIGIVFDGHGAECGGTAVLKQDGLVFRWAHRLYWSCYH